MKTNQIKACSIRMHLETSIIYKNIFCTHKTNIIQKKSYLCSENKTFGTHKPHCHSIVGVFIKYIAT